VPAPSRCIWQCTTVGNERHLAADPNELCYGPAYEKLLNYSYLALVVYGLGIPVAFSFILVRYRYDTLQPLLRV
jgi:hypothetical protein